MFDDEEEDEGFYESHLKEDLKKFDAFLKGEPIGFLDSDRWEAMIDHFLINGQYSNALTCTEEAFSQFSYNPLFTLRRAQCYSALGKLKEALSELNDVERLGVASFELVLTKASVFSQLKDSKNAIRYFRESLGLAAKEDKDEVYLDLAMEYENMNDFKSALNVLREAIDYNPNNEAAIYEVAFCYDQLKEYEKSIQCYSDFIDENPYSFTAWYNLGNAYLKLENFEKAIWAYDYCILINDDFGPVYFNMGNAYLSHNRFTKAIEQFHKCIELDGDDPIAFCYIGECHEQLNELELAKHFYQRSLDLAPLLPDAWLGLGIVKDLEGSTKEGLVLIQKALELDPENAGIYHVLAGAYEKIEEYQEASDNYQLSLAMDPMDEECLTDYINLLALNSFREAYEYLMLFEETAQENKVIALLKVNLLWNLGENNTAVEIFKQCLSTNLNKAKELFELYPELKNARELVLLADN
ncbi:MAG: tetratricopeptide repeat protein [Crocinitomicaceae bacterium]|nr:tetratricopeptide repeat protein [Crocinitomicaceae bacterium]